MKSIIETFFETTIALVQAERKINCLKIAYKEEKKKNECLESLLEIAIADIKPNCKNCKYRNALHGGCIDKCLPKCSNWEWVHADEVKEVLKDEEY